jgi:quercetin dioxygenase-like cupin family protein
MKNNPSPTPKIVRQGEGECLDLGGQIRHQLLDGHDTCGLLTLAHSTFRYHSGTALHLHTKEDEWFHIEHGEFEFQIGETKTSLHAGDFVFAPRLIPHGYRCESKNGGALYSGTFGAGLEEFYRAMAHQFESGLSTRDQDIEKSAANYGIHFSDFGNFDVAASLPQIVRTNEGECIQAFGNKMRVLLSTRATQGHFACSDTESPPLGGPPLHVHEYQTELFIVRAGRFEFQIGDARVQVGVGDVVLAPHGVPHTFRNISSETGRFLTLVTPGDFEDFFREAKGLFERGAITPQAMTTLGDKFGIRFFPVSV